MKRADLETTKLKSNFSITQYFSSDPDRHRSERIATLDYEISSLDKDDKDLKEELKVLESEIEANLQVILIKMLVQLQMISRKKTFIK